MYSLIIKPRAILMTKEAYIWYEGQKPGLGEEFLKELDSYYDKLQSHPEYFGKIKSNFRQTALKRFPYVVVFEIMQNEVVVFSVFHTKRNPKLKFKD
ncbi:MAG TPA: type II toxin-antitoxin system RelE/ParE family toxin [Hanamia sp.]|jgi:Plasmid stabilisation system protein.